MQDAQENSGKNKKREGNCCEWKQICVLNVLETTWNHNNCCLNINIALKVADTTFNICKLFQNSKSSAKYALGI